MQTEIQQTAPTDEKTIQIATEMLKINYRLSKDHPDDEQTYPNWGKLFDLALDLLGVPEEVDVDGKWNDNSYSRDWVFHLYDDIVYDHSCMDKFVNAVLEILKMNNNYDN